MNTEQLILKIKLYLLEKKVKKYRLEDMCGLPRGTIYRFVKGNKQMTIKTAEKILDKIDT